MEHTENSEIREIAKQAVKAHATRIVSEHVLAATTQWIESMDNDETEEKNIAYERMRALVELQKQLEAKL